MEYEQELHDYWKNIIDNGYVNLPSTGCISYWLSHIELCHKEIISLQSTIDQQANIIRLLKEMLQKDFSYMQHKSECLTRIRQVNKRGECNCGFFELNNKYTELMAKIDKAGV